MTAQESDDGHAATAAAASAQRVQGQFDDAGQVGHESGKQNKQAPAQSKKKSKQKGGNKRRMEKNRKKSEQSGTGS